MKQNVFFGRCRAFVLALAILGGVSSLGLAAQSDFDTNFLTLEGAVQVALDSNPEARGFEAHVTAAAGRAYQAKLWSNPELELSAEDWPVSGGRGFSDAKQTIGVAQTLPFPGKKSLDKKIGHAGVQLSEAQLAVRKTEIVRDTKAGFYRVLASERQVEVSRELLKIAESSAVTAQKRVDAGAAPYQEQLRAEVQLEQARAELMDFERDLATARQAFATVLGRPDLKGVRLKGVLPETSSVALTGAEGLLAQHPSAAVARATVQQAELAYRRSRLEPYPDVRVGVSGGRIGSSDESIIQLGVSVPLPIIDRGKGKQQETRANIKAAQAELDTVLQQLEREFANAQKRYRTAVEQVTNYRERTLPKANEALRLVQTGFEQGKFNFIDLVDTQRTTAQVRLAYLEKLLEMNVAQAELEALLKPQRIGVLITK